MTLQEDEDIFESRTSVEVFQLDPNTEKNIAKRLGLKVEDVIERLGARESGSRGIVTKRFLCFGSIANEVAYVDEFGSRNGKMGILFPGEGRRIPDILINE